MNNFTYGEIAGLIIFFIGIYGVIARRNILKTIISFGVMQSGIILFYIASINDVNYAPIGEELLTKTTADPIPQSLMITVVVIGIAVTAVSITMFINLYHKYGTTNWLKVKNSRTKS